VQQTARRNRISFARCVHDERQHPARNHSNSIEDADRGNAQKVPQAGKEHRGGLRDQRSAYHGRQSRLLAAFRDVACGPVGKGVQQLRGDEAAERERSCLRRRGAVTKGSVEPGPKRASRDHACLGAQAADVVPG
jgi:hypothetical protein